MLFRPVFIPLLLALAASAAPDTPDRGRATPIPLPPFAPLAVTAPEKPPEKSRILRKEETWELPDVVRTEVNGNYVVSNYESDKIIAAALVIGLDSDKVSAWDHFYEDDEQRLTNLEGEIRYPDGRKIPLDRETHLFETLRRSAGKIDDRKGKNDEASLPPKARLWSLLIPGAPPGTVIAYRAVMHYDFLPSLTLGYADSPLPTDHYRLLIRSNHRLWSRARGFFSGKLNLSEDRKADFNPRGKAKHGFWQGVTRTRERWEADAAIFPRGTNLRAGRQERKGEVSELEFLADDVPAFEREVMMPSDRRIRPMVAAMFSEHAPATDLGYWEKEFDKEHRDESLAHFMAKRPDEKEFDRAKILGEGDAWTRIERAAEWLRIHYKPDEEVRFDPDVTFAKIARKMSGNWAHRCYLFAALLREAGYQAELASVFPAYELPIQPELTDPGFYRGPYLAVRVSADGRTGFFNPAYQFTPGARLPTWFWGGATYRYAADGAHLETIPADAPERNGENFSFTGTLDAQGKAEGGVKARFFGLTAARVRERLKTDKPLEIHFTEAEMEHMDEKLAEERAKSAAMSSISAEAYLKERFGGVPKDVKAAPYTADKTVATFEGGWSREGFAGDGMPLLVSDLGLDPYFTDRERRFPVRNLEPELHRLDFDVAIPAGRRPSRPEYSEEITGPGGFRFKAEARFADGRWRGHWEMMEVIDEVPAADYPKLRDAERLVFTRLHERLPFVATR